MLVLRPDGQRTGSNLTIEIGCYGGEWESGSLCGTCGGGSEVEVVELEFGEVWTLSSGFVDELGIDAEFAGEASGAFEAGGPHSVEDVVGAGDGADGGLEEQATDTADLSAAGVHCGIVVSHGDVVFEDERAGGTAGIPAVDVVGGRLVSDDGVVGHQRGSSLAEVEGEIVAGAAEVRQVGVVA